jgi:DNA-binding CsgD family transcriptional regulator
MFAAESTSVREPRGGELAELVEAARAMRGGALERQLLAAALKAVAAWLTEQSVLLDGAPSFSSPGAAGGNAAPNMLGGAPPFGSTATPAFASPGAANDEPSSNVRVLPKGLRRSEWVLTPREREVASLIARGFSNRKIAEELVIADSTCERHVANILNKLGMRSRSQIAVWAVHHGLV